MVTQHNVTIQIEHRPGLLDKLDLVELAQEFVGRSQIRKGVFGTFLSNAVCTVHLFLRNGFFTASPELKFIEWRINVVIATVSVATATIIRQIMVRVLQIDQYLKKNCQSDFIIWCYVTPCLLF